MPEEREDITALRTRVEQLETTVQRLVEELATRDANDSMRRGVRCPACGARSIVHAEKVLDQSDAGSGQLALHKRSAWTNKVAGPFEAFVCEGCGLVEWYVQTMDGVPLEGSQFRRVGLPPGGPGGGGYR